MQPACNNISLSICAYHGISKSGMVSSCGAFSYAEFIWAEKECGVVNLLLTQASESSFCVFRMHSFWKPQGTHARKTNKAPARHNESSNAICEDDWWTTNLFLIITGNTSNDLRKHESAFSAIYSFSKCDDKSVIVSYAQCFLPGLRIYTQL